MDASLIIAFKLDLTSCVNWDGFYKSSHICVYHDYHEILYHDISSITIIVASLAAAYF